MFILRGSVYQEQKPFLSISKQPAAVINPIVTLPIIANGTLDTKVALNEVTKPTQNNSIIISVLFFKVYFFSRIKIMGTLDTNVALNEVTKPTQNNSIIISVLFFKVYFYSRIKIMGAFFSNPTDQCIKESNIYQNKGKLLVVLFSFCYFMGDLYYICTYSTSE